MNPGWEESEFVYCDLQDVARFIKRQNPTAARAFLEAAYDAFEFLVRNPGAGRRRGDLGFPEVRSWRIEAFRRILVFYKETPDRIQILRVLHGARDLRHVLSK
jgi:toxin ParE1/3/4